MTNHPPSSKAKLCEYEEKVVDFFVRSGQVKGVAENFSRIFGYFVTRRQLTQTDIQNLAGTSAGTTSKVLQMLVSIGIVHVSKIPGSRENLYELVDFGEMMVNSLEGTIKEYLKSRQKFLKRIRRQFDKIDQKIEAIKQQGGNSYLIDHNIDDKISPIRGFIKEFTKILPVLEKGIKMFREKSIEIDTEYRY